jgi:hypothetical protein
MRVFVLFALYYTSIGLLPATPILATPCPGSNVVTSCSEAGLREAITRGGNVILCCSGTISLTSTIHITNDVVVDAENRAVIISGNNSVRLFRVAANATLELKNLTLANGRHIGTNGASAGSVAGQLAQPGEDGNGGAIYNQGGTVRLISCVLSNNAALGGRDGQTFVPNMTPAAVGAGRGGAVSSENGQVTFQNVLAVGNWAMGALRLSGMAQEGNGPTLGGALSAVGGTVYITNSSFVSNVATGRVSALFTSFSAPVKGGAIYLQSAFAIVHGGDFSGNLALAQSVGSTERMQSGGSTYGGALFSGASTVTVAQSSLSMNKALAGSGSATFGGISGEAQGGAIYSDGTLHLVDTSVSRNEAISGGFSTANKPGRGGGLLNGGTAHVSRSTFDGNIATGAEGGVRFDPTSGGDGLGGGIANIGTLNGTNCTVVLNRAQAGGTYGQPVPIAFGGTPAGGGIHSATGMLRLMNVTLASNVVIQGMHSRPPGGANLAHNGGAMLSANSLVAFGLISSNNVTTLHSNVSGTITDGGFNLSSDNSWAFTSGTSSGNTDPKLAPLDDYGGETRTMALLAGSPAIDAATGPDCPPTDQRGVSRPAGPACDIGAFESAPLYSVRGRISGFRVPSGIQVSAGTGSGVTDSNLTYQILGLAAGAHAVVPSPLHHVIVPASRNVSLGPDLINVDFTAYRRNSLSPERSNNTVRLVYAGTNGAVIRIQVSNDLISWTDHSTNTVGSDGLLHVPLQNSGTGGRYFRAVQP